MPLERFLHHLQRYYIAERDADRLTQRLGATRTARLRVAIDGAGRPQIDALLIDGEPIERAR